MAGTLDVVRVPVLADNYAWLIHDAESGETVALDPGEAQPMIDEATRRGWMIGTVWLTHWHPDHVGGVPTLRGLGAQVIGPAAEREKIDTLDLGVSEGDTVAIGGHVASVMAVPGHTQGHIAFHFPAERLLFTGDTLFAMGCGRLFEGTAEDMFGNMRRYAALPDDTQVFCGHEYTQSNGRFALVAEPDNAAIMARMREVDALRDRGDATVPTTIGVERATNPFLRAETAAALGDLRRAKDGFTG